MADDRERIPTPEEFEQERGRTFDKRQRPDAPAPVPGVARKRRLRDFFHVPADVAAAKTMERVEDMPRPAIPTADHSVQVVEQQVTVEAGLPQQLASDTDTGSAGPDLAGKRVRKITMPQPEPVVPTAVPVAPAKAPVVPALTHIPDQNQKVWFERSWSQAHVLGHALGNFARVREDTYDASCRRCSAKTTISLEVPDNYTTKQATVVQKGDAHLKRCSG